MTKQYIDMTPTWEETARICATILLHAENDGAKKTAIGELERMGRILDRMKETGKLNAECPPKPPAD